MMKNEKSLESRARMGVLRREIVLEYNVHNILDEVEQSRVKYATKCGRRDGRSGGTISRISRRFRCLRFPLGFRFRTKTHTQTAVARNSCFPPRPSPVRVYRTNVAPVVPKILLGVYIITVRVRTSSFFARIFVPRPARPSSSGFEKQQHRPAPPPFPLAQTVSRTIPARGWFPNNNITYIRACGVFPFYIYTYII